MNLTLVFRRKYRWPEHYFSVWSLGNSQKLLTTNQFYSQYNIFYNYEYLFFQSAFCSLFNHRQRSQSNQEQCSLCCSSHLFSCFAVHSLRAVAVLFNIFSSIIRNRSFTAHISRLKPVKNEVNKDTDKDFPMSKSYWLVNADIIAV